MKAIREKDRPEETWKSITPQAIPISCISLAGMKERSLAELDNKTIADVMTRVADDRELDGECKVYFSAVDRAQLVR